MQDYFRLQWKLQQIVLVAAVLNVSSWLQGCHPDTVAAITVCCDSCWHQDTVGTSGVPHRQAAVPRVGTLHVAVVTNSFLCFLGS